MTNTAINRGRASADRLLRHRAATVVGFTALFSGAALLGNIVFGTSLVLGLAVLGGLASVASFVVLRRATRDERRRLRLVVVSGIAAGFVATICYDAAKALLSQVDPSPYNPFDATRVFGTLLLGDAAPLAAVQTAGIALHLLNGTAFGIAFTALFGADRALSVRRALAYGIGWGLFLELFQLTLYPGWLDIRAYREFATISALSHVVYGATLGLTGRAMLRRRLGDAHPTT